MLKDLDLQKYPRVFIACGYTDMRQGINSLAALVQYRFRQDPLGEGAVFLFCGRRRDRIKALAHDDDGYVLMYKRLFKGRYQWPMSEEEAKGLTPYEYSLLMDGYSIETSIERDAASRVRQQTMPPTEEGECPT